MSSQKSNGQVFESGIFEDIRITSDPRTNSIIIDAPPKTMELILALIREMDVPPFARAEVTVFTLRKVDAVQAATTLQKLFLNQGGLTSTGTTTATGTGGGGGGGGALGTGTLGATTAKPLQLTVNGISIEGAPIIDLRLTVDERTNSIIVAGSRNDLDVIQAILDKLDSTDARERRTEAYKLRNALAADVAAALNVFLPAQLKIYTNSNQLTGFQELQRDVVITPEPISNTLLISASPQFFDTVMKLIFELDVMPPQVMIQVLIAEVDVTNSDEFGVQIGLQTPVIFQRGLTSSGGTGFTSSTLNQALVSTANPGFSFNQTAIPPGNTSVVSPGTVGYQGINNLGVGLVSPLNGVGGFVFSAASDSFNVLVRALAVQNRLTILSRPQIMTLDNQTALINTGQNIPLIASSTVVVGAGVTQNIVRQAVGVVMQVTPKIMPDGQILMRIIPEVSAVDPTPLNLGNGALGTVLDVQHVETTVTAYDGQTIALGGLLSKSDNKNENKIPILGDLPGVGALFRYRTHNKNQKELIFIMTPHIVALPGRRRSSPRRGSRQDALGRQRRAQVPGAQCPGCHDGRSFWPLSGRGLRDADHAQDNGYAGRGKPGTANVAGRSSADTDDPAGPELGAAADDLRAADHGELLSGSGPHAATHAVGGPDWPVRGGPECPVCNQPEWPVRGHPGQSIGRDNQPLYRQPACPACPVYATGQYAAEHAAGRAPRHRPGDSADRHELPIALIPGDGRNGRHALGRDACSLLAQVPRIS